LKSSEFAEGDGELGFNGFDGKVEEVCDVFVFEAIFFDEGEDKFAAWGKLVDGGAEALEGFGAEEEGFGVGLEADIGVAALADLNGVDAGIIAQIIQGPVLHGHIQVKPGIIYRRSSVPVFPKFKKDIINDLFGGFFVMDNRKAESEQPDKIKPVQRFESSFPGRFNGVTNQVFCSCFHSQTILKVNFFNCF
jgi:hypothetical protein